MDKFRTVLQNFDSGIIPKGCLAKVTADGEIVLSNLVIGLSGIAGICLLLLSKRSFLGILLGFYGFFLAMLVTFMPERTKSLGDWFVYVGPLIPGLVIAKILTARKMKRD